MKMPIVVVRWMDAHSDGGWIDSDGLNPDPYEVTSVGIELAAKTGHVTIAQSLGSDIYDHVLHIPCGMVSEMYIIGTIDVESD